MDPIFAENLTGYHLHTLNGSHHGLTSFIMGLLGYAPLGYLHTTKHIHYGTFVLNHVRLRPVYVSEWRGWEVSLQLQGKMLL